MSPTVSELQDVLDWEAASVLQAIDQHGEADIEDVVETTGIDRKDVENRVQQLDTLGLITAVDEQDGSVYELTGAGHGAIGSGLFEEYELVGEADLDELAGEVAELLDQRDALEAKLESLRSDAEEVRTRAERTFGDRDDVTEEFESLLADIESLEATLADDQ